MFAALANTGRFIASHPLTRDRKLAAFGRFARWQIESRVREAVVVPWVGGTRLLVKRGMAGATGNIYCGLHEFAEMAFLLHLLRPGDLFADIGANVGSYTVLAAGVRKARVIAVEPGSAARAALLENVALNGLSNLVRVQGVALGAAGGTIALSVGLNSMNHILSESDLAHEEVEQSTADALFGDECPLLLKLDVEGYEAAVLAGGAATLVNPKLKALIVELNGSGRRYGFYDEQIHQSLLELSFTRCEYAAFRREFHNEGGADGASDRPRGGRTSDNAIYVRDLDWVRHRVETAPMLRVLSKEI